VDTALAIQMNDAGSGLALVGPGSLEQVTPGADLLVYGRNLAEVADNMLISNLRLKGGGIAGKALRLNNALGGLFDHVEIYNFAYGIYTEGQNERHSFRDCYLEGFTTSGIYCGVSNGEAVWGGVLDYPVLQKCLFERVRVGGSTGPAVVITAGIIDGVQRTSGINRFERLVLEGNKQNGLEFHFSFMSAISGMSNEDYLDTNGVYYALLITDGSMVSARDLYLGCGAQANDYAAKIRLNGGTLFLSDSTVSGAHVSAVADISVLGTLEATNVIVTDKDAIVFDSGASHDRSLLHNVMDAAGVPITNWDALTAIPNAISPSANGVYVPQLVVNTLIHRVVDSGGQLIELHLPASGSAYNRIVFGSTTASEAGFQFDHAAGIKAIKGDVSGLASFYAAHFYLETPADYTVVSPTTLRTIDVSAATLSDVRQVLGTLIADLQAAGLLT
jgi:hypothetical protein